MCASYPPVPAANKSLSNQLVRTIITFGGLLNGAFSNTFNTIEIEFVLEFFKSIDGGGFQRNGENWEISLATPPHSVAIR